MQLLSYGAETRFLDGQAWSLVSGTAGGDATYPRRVYGGAGGKYALRVQGTADSPSFAEVADGMFARVPFRIVDVTANMSILFRDVATPLLELRLETTGEVGVYVRGVSKGVIGFVPLRGAWHTLSIQADFSATATRLSIYVDGDIRIPVYTLSETHTFTSLTSPTALRLSADDAYFDDIAVNAPSIAFLGGGALPIGGTVTGQTSGATAHIVTFNTASSVGTLKNIVGTFRYGEALLASDGTTGTSGATATNSNTLGLDQNSTHPSPDGYEVLLQPNMGGSLNASVAIPAQGAGLKYLNVYDWTPTTVDAMLLSNSGGVVKQTFNYPDIDPTSVAVDAITLAMRSQSDAGGNWMANLMVIGGVEHSSGASFIGARRAVLNTRETNPATLSRWTLSDIASLEAGWWSG